MAARPGVTFLVGTWGGVTNGFIAGDRGRERTAPGIQVDDITDERVVEGVEGSVNVKRRAH